VEDCDTFDVVKLIIGLFADEMAQEEEKVMTAGTDLDFDDVIGLIYALPSKYRMRAVFLSHNANIRELRKVKDSQNRYIWMDSPAPGQSATIHGYPVYENNHLPESEIYFGDFKLGYWLGDRKRMTVTVSREAGTAWEKDQVGIRVVERIAGNCILEAAMRKLTSIP